MKSELKIYKIDTFTTRSGAVYSNFILSYQLFGKPLHTAPVVLVNHALTGNSDVIGEEKGWWKSLIGPGKTIDTQKYTIIAFNMPGNGYDGNYIHNYKDFVLGDIAQLYSSALNGLGIDKLYAAIGGSIGGCLAWELAAIEPTLIKYLIPIACDWKSSDWIIGNCYVQENILANSSKPLEDARIMSMLFYRTAQSFTQKFQRTRTDDNKLFNVESWLRHHGKKLNGRFALPAYKMMNHLLATVDITAGRKSFDSVASEFETKIIQVSINSDILFIPEDILNTKSKLDRLGIENEYHEIKSIHGHDAFLIEFEQLNTFLKPIF